MPAPGTFPPEALVVLVVEPEVALLVTPLLALLAVTELVVEVALVVESPVLTLLAVAVLPDSVWSLTNVLL
jgi:hypothetical protein